MVNGPLADAAPGTAPPPGFASVDPVAFWEAAARRLEWAEPWHTAHTWSPAVPDPHRPGSLTVPVAEWFLGGRLNVAVNCVDRHVAAGRGDTVALHFEGERGDSRTLTYADLQREVSRAANALAALGIGPGDRVVVYLPVLPETVVVTLAIARLGAISSLVFCGLAAESLRHRLADVGAKLLVTSDGQFRSGAALPVKATADAAVDGPGVAHVLVVRRTGEAVPWTTGRDVWWHDVVRTAPSGHVAEAFDAEAPLFIAHTSGTTGRPKGLVHTAGGYLTQAAWTFATAFDHRPGDVHWCTADLAWITGHTYALFGPLANGATQVLYEGTPGTPDRARHARIIERYGVTSYYTAPTVIRTLMSWFPDGFADHDLSSIRVLGSVGEPINPEAWHWYREHMGAGRAPVVDTWWQSETGAAMVAPLGSSGKPGSAGRPLPGISVAVVDDDGSPVGPGTAGLLVVDRPWPAMARTIWGDAERYRDTYWARFAGHGDDGQGYYLSGDGAKYDADGDLWLLGRVDDVINVSGHRLSTIEIESALVEHPEVAEAGVTGVDDPTSGQAIAAFVIPARPPRPAHHADDDAAAWVASTGHLADDLRGHIARSIGPIARPRDVVVVPDLPRTRSGKIMRRLLADLLAGRPPGDVTSLQDSAVVTTIAAVLDARRAAETREIA
jgi:acetyl-CoA synthetase